MTANTMPTEMSGETCPYKRKTKRGWIVSILCIYVAFVFVQSLFYKFSDAPETQFIFTTLDFWGADLTGLHLFAPGKIFSAKMIGSAELVASSLLIASLITRRIFSRVLGSALGLAIMTGAINFHLFTPLGVEVQGDGGLLFGMACGVWLSCLAMLLMDRAFIKSWLCGSSKKSS